MYPDSDPNHSQTLMACRLDQNASSDFFQEDPSSSILVILLTNRKIPQKNGETNKKTNGHENNTSKAEVIMAGTYRHNIPKSKEAEGLLYETI